MPKIQKPDRKFVYISPLKAMREGKKVRCLSLSPNTFELEPWTKRFFVNDGMNLLPIYGIKDEYLLADDWEIVE